MRWWDYESMDPVDHDTMGAWDKARPSQLVPTHLEALANFLNQLKDSDGEINNGAFKLIVQKRGRVARQILAWKLMRNQLHGQGAQGVHVPNSLIEYYHYLT